MQNLVNELSSNLSSSNFKKVVLALVMTPAEYAAKLLNKAIQVSAVHLISDCFGTKQQGRAAISQGSQLS